jgi:hypothetical protein
MHLRYTAREGGEILRTATNDSLITKLNDLISMNGDKGLFHSLSTRSDFPNEWNKLLNPPYEQKDSKIELHIETDHFPQILRERKIKIEKVFLCIVFKTTEAETQYKDGNKLKLTIFSPDDLDSKEITLDETTDVIPLYHGSWEIEENPGIWRIEIKENDIKTLDAEFYKLISNGEDRYRLSDSTIQDITIIIKYSIK